MENKNIILGISILVSFMLVIVGISFYNAQVHQSRMSNKLSSEMLENMTIEEVREFVSHRKDSQPKFYSYYYLPFFALIGILVGTIVYYLMAGRIKEKETSLKNNSRIILKFLTGQERNVIDILLENDGKVPQYEISHLPNMNKVKTHRILENLLSKGIIEKQKLGKVNKIILNKELLEVLKE